MASAPTVRRSRRLGRSLSALWVAGILGVTLSVVGLLSLPTYRAYKRQRGREAARRSLQHLGTNGLELSLQQARLANALAPTDLWTRRALARVAEKAGFPDSMALHQTLVATPGSTHEDLLCAARVALRTRTLDLGLDWTRQLMKEVSGDPEAWWIHNQLLRHAGSVPRQAAAVALALQKWPDDPRFLIDLADVQLKLRDPEANKAGQAGLWKLATQRTEPPEVQLRAAELLAQAPGLGEADWTRLISALEESQAQSWSHRLLATQFHLARQPAKRQQLMDEVQRNMPAELSVQDRLGFAVWFLQHGEPQRALGVLDGASAPSVFGLIECRVDCLFAMGAVDRLESMCGERNLLPEPMRLAVQGALKFREQKPSDAEPLMRASLTSAGPYLPVVAPFILRHSQQAAHPGLVRECLEALLRVPGPDLDAARQLLRLHSRDRSVAPSLQILRHLNQRMPSEPSIALERAWFELLTGQNLDWATAQVQSLAAQAPDHPDIAFASALARWRRGEFEQALDLIETRAADPSTLLPRRRIVYALVLHSVGRREVARRVVQTLSDDDLRMELDALVAPLR